MNTNRRIWNNSNIHNNTSAGTVLHTIKGERTAGLLSNNLSRFADVPWPLTTHGLVFNVRKTVQSTTQRLQRLLSFRTSPQEGLLNRTTSPTLSCSRFVADSHEDNFNIEVSKVSRSPRWLQTISQHQRFKFPNSVAISVQPLNSQLSLWQ